MQTAKDYHDKYLSYKRTNWSQGIKAGYVKMYTPPEVVGMPDSIDWRTKTAVTDVKYQVKGKHIITFTQQHGLSMQDGCGASYAFASTGTLEGAYALTYDTNAKDLSEQNLIDCSGIYYNCTVQLCGQKMHGGSLKSLTVHTQRNLH